MGCGMEGAMGSRLSDTVLEQLKYYTELIGGLLKIRRLPPFPSIGNILLTRRGTSGAQLLSDQFYSSIKKHNKTRQKNPHVLDLS